MENIIIQLHHIIYSTLGILTLLGILLKLYVNSLKKDIRENYNEEISKCKNSLETKQEKEIESLYKKIDRECSTESIKSKVRDFVDGELKLIQSDVVQIKTSMLDLKTIMNTQQETLIAIQMSITELKPRLENLEGRVQRLEDKDK